MPSIAIVAGTRPECLKTASLVRALRLRSEVRALLLGSGQHQAMVTNTFAHLGLACDVDLPQVGGHSLSTTVAALRAQLREACRDIGATVLVSQGDTSTAYATALAARDLGVPLAHVEAGLRTGDPMRPFPEEAFRRRIAPLAQWHFAPTASAAENLLHERVAAERVHVVGNTIIDELRLALAMQATSDPPAAVGRRLVTLTLHRRENYGRGLDTVCGAVLALLARRHDLEVVCPVHPNPTVGNRIRRLLSAEPRVRLVDPMPYRPFVQLLRASQLVITDSGGIQEEAPYLGTPVLVARDATERPEALATGFVRLVPLRAATIVEAALEVLDQPRPRPVPFAPGAPFGDGHSAERIADVLCAALAPVPAHASPREHAP